MDADSEQKTITPNPGSKEAIDRGCTCPVMDNCFGRGSGFGGFWIDDTCPIHGKLIPE